MATEIRGKAKQVKPVTERVTILKDSTIGPKGFVRQIKSDIVTKFRGMELDHFFIFEGIILKALKRQRKAGLNYLKIDIEFNLIERTLTITDNSVGLSKEEIITIPLDVRFSVHNHSPIFDEKLSILELATYFGTSLDLLNVTKTDTDWIHINIVDMLNTERVDVVKDVSESDSAIVENYLPGTGLRIHITNVPLAYKKGWTLIPSPDALDSLREQIASRFANIMQKTDLIIRLLYKAKMISNYDDKDKPKPKKRGIFFRKKK